MCSEGVHSFLGQHLFLCGPALPCYRRTAVGPPEQLCTFAACGRWVQSSTWLSKQAQQAKGKGPRTQSQHRSNIHIVPMLALRRSWRHGLRVGSWAGHHRAACACASEQAECAPAEPGSVSEYHAHVLVRLPAPEGAARHGAWWPKFVEK